MEKIEEIVSRVKRLREAMEGCKFLVSGVHRELGELEQLLGEDGSPEKDPEDVKEK